jgi:hypothetical protein
MAEPVRARRVSRSTSHRVQHLFEDGETVGDSLANAIIGGPLLNGDFNADTSPVDSQTFADTPRWFNLTGDQTKPATTLSDALPTPDSSRVASLSDAGDRQVAIDTGYILTAGQKLELSYQWSDGTRWDDAADQVRVTLFTTSDDTPAGMRSDVGSLLSGPSTLDSTYEAFAAPFAPVPAAAAGKRRFVVFEGVDGDASPGGLANLNGGQGAQATRTNLVFDGLLVNETPKTDYSATGAYGNMRCSAISNCTSNFSSRRIATAASTSVGDHTSVKYRNIVLRPVR